MSFRGERPSKHADAPLPLGGGASACSLLVALSDERARSLLVALATAVVAAARPLAAAASWARASGVGLRLACAACRATGAI